MASEFLSKINVMDENILTLLRYWDMEGEFAKMGIFEENPDMQAIYRHVIISTLLTISWGPLNRISEVSSSKEHF